MKSASIVVVGASWGGLSALTRIVSGLPDDLCVPVAIVQHRSKDAANLLAGLLQDATQLRVVDAEDKEPLCAGGVYIAPANYHMMVEEDHFALTTDPMVRFSRPSIDVTFMSAADAFPGRTVGVVLTGANDDGARGLRHIVRRGGTAIVQDPRTAESPTMPRAALAAVPTAEVIALEKIAERVTELCSVAPSVEHRVRVRAETRER